MGLGWVDFSEEMLLRYDALAGRYFCRPSELAEVSGWAALALDEACFEAGQARLAASLGSGGLVFSVLPLR